MEITDADLRFLILGMFAEIPRLEAFPIKVREVVTNRDEHGDPQSFTIVTESGLRYTVTCTFDGETDAHPT